MSRRQFVIALLVFFGLLFVFGGDVAWAQDGEEGPKSVSLWQLYLYGGIVGFILTALSAASLGLGIEQALILRRDEMLPPELIDHIEDLFAEESYEKALEVCEERPSLLTNMLAAGLPRLGTTRETLERAMEEAAGLELDRLTQKVSVIGLIAAIAPLLGLFGTVMGMIGTFNTIATSPVAPKPAELAGGIQQALVTTCMGLMVAIPTTVLFFVFRGRLNRAVLEVRAVVAGLMEPFVAE